MFVHKNTWHQDLEGSTKKKRHPGASWQERTTIGDLLQTVYVPDRENIKNDIKMAPTLSWKSSMLANIAR